MSFTLRPYQSDCARACVEFLNSPEREHGLCIAPTGSGKSIIIAEVARQLEGPCVIFQPSREILQQNYAKLRSYGEWPGIFSASMGEKRIDKITLATIGSVKKHAARFRQFQYAMCDEAHGVNARGGMYSDFFAALPDLKILGLTATPYRLSTDGYGGSILKFLTRTRPRVFSKVVWYCQIGDLHRDGYLAPLQYREIEAIDKSKLALNSTGADYTDQSVQHHFAAVNFKDRVVETVNGLLNEKRSSILVFTRFISESQYLVSQIPGAAIVTGDTPESERDRILSEFKSGKVKVACNVGVLTVGFDYPALATVVLARPTMSLALYYQMIGRSVRTHPEKPYALVVDMVGLVEQFGKVEDMVLRENGSKWCYTSGDRQLTNQYYGEQPYRAVANGDLIPPLDWTETPNGLRTAPATGAFWNAWRERKEAIKAAGVYVRKIGREFIVCSTKFK